MLLFHYSRLYLMIIVMNDHLEVFNIYTCPLSCFQTPSEPLLPTAGLAVCRERLCSVRRDRRSFCACVKDTFDVWVSHLFQQPNRQKDSFCT